MITTYKNSNWSDHFIKKKKILGAFPVNRLISQVPNILLYLHIDMCAKYLKKKKEEKNLNVLGLWKWYLYHYMFLKEKKTDALTISFAL